jgi:DNA-binding Lrp family transcriptional regulator
VESITIDELDRQLVQCLGVNGRATFSELAAVLGVSDQTAARRYKRLRSSGVLRVVGLSSRVKVGPLGWFLRLRCVPGAGQAIADALAKRPDTAWISLLSGDTEVLTALRGGKPEDQNSLLAKLPRSSRIVAVTAYSLLHMFTGGPDALGFLDVLPPERVEPLRRPGTGGDPRDVQLGELDTALLRELAIDGRASHADLAAATGWSESAVRRRMDQLLDTGVLYFDLELDIPTFGFRSSAWLWMSVPPARLAETGKALGAFPEVAYAVATTGPANLVVCVVCRDESALYQFLTEKVGTLPGVERVETAPIIRTVKQATTAVIPA